MFLTPQPVAYNKTEIRKSSQNTHPKAKPLGLKKETLGLREWRPAAGSPRGKGTPALAGKKHNTKKKQTNKKKKKKKKKQHPWLPLLSRGEPEKKKKNNQIVPSSESC